MRDLISREAAIKALNIPDYENGEAYIQYQADKAAIEMVQTDMGSDLISRQAALDGFCEMASDMDHLCTIDDYTSYIESLPAQSEQRWIPVSERLPEESGRYIVSVLDGIDRRTTVAPYQTRCKAWTMTGRMAYWKVIAWMPLPEPYKGEQE